ncbi:MAG: TetR/AcrR family transcriptional regulator [Rhodospirillaceae bacterium]|nr:TetR/AcrR family transcriptional regulator [Rhodospirillaceae bacterium]
MSGRKRLMPLPKTGRGEITRRKILDAARREIGRRGFASTSVSSITAEAGVGQGTFYIYFRSKEDVLRELVLHMGRNLRRHLSERIAGAKTRIEAERRGLRAFLEFIRRNPDHYRVVEVSQFVDARAYRKYYTDFARAYRAALTAAERNGELRPGIAEVRAWSLMGMAVYLGQRYALMDSKAPLDPIVDTAMDMIAHGLTR